MILIVEDDEGVAELMKHIVQRAGFDSFIAYSSANALQWITTNVPQFILMDYHLPDGCAYDLILEMRDLRSVLPPIVVTTGECEFQIAEKLAPLGVQQCMIKDGRFLDELPKVIQAIVKIS